MTTTERIKDIKERLTALRLWPDGTPQIANTMATEALREFYDE